MLIKITVNIIQEAVISATTQDHAVADAYRSK